MGRHRSTTSLSHLEIEAEFTQNGKQFATHILWKDFR
jgi:hypothetical protein